MTGHFFLSNRMILYCPRSGRCFLSCKHLNEPPYSCHYWSRTGTVHSSKGVISLQCQCSGADTTMDNVIIQPNYVYGFSVKPCFLASLTLAIIFQSTIIEGSSFLRKSVFFSHVSICWRRRSIPGGRGLMLSVGESPMLETTLQGLIPEELISDFALFLFAFPFQAFFFALYSLLQHIKIVLYISQGCFKD